MTPQERLDYLIEVEFVPVNRPILFTDISNLVGLQAAAMVVGTLKQAAIQNPLLETVVIAMSSVGLFINTAERQGMIDQLAIAGEWPDEVRDAVKGLGGSTQPRWQTQGYEIAPTLELVTKELIISAARSKLTNIAAFLDTVDLSEFTAESLQAAIDSRMSSENGTVAGGD